jgi:glycerate kinase
MAAVDSAQTTDVAQVLVSPDKFKGTLTAAEVAAHVAAGLQQAHPGLTVMTAPVADGGDGTVEAAVAAGFRRVAVTVTGPVGAVPVDAGFAIRHGTAVVELAAASGLALLGERRDPLGATSRGTGELIRAALDAGATEIVLGAGGSACTDGGAGMLQALGARLLDATGEEVPPGGAALLRLARVELAGLDTRLRDTRITLAGDVDNPLLGAQGAAAVYGPQKGANPDDVELLDTALARWAGLVDLDAAQRPGSGAAGGVGYAALAVLGAALRPGIEVLLELIGFAALLADATLVVTGEGALDEQTLRGKAPMGVAAAARRAGVPVVAVCGVCELSAERLAAVGLGAAYALTDVEPDVLRCRARPGPLLEQLAGRIDLGLARATS